MKNKYLHRIIGTILTAGFILGLMGCGNFSKSETETVVSETMEEETGTIEEEKDETGEDATALTETKGETEILAEAKEQMAVSFSEQIVSGMTNEEKVAQLFVVAPEALWGVSEIEGAKSAEEDAGTQKEETVTEFDKRFQKGMETYPVGGIVFFKKNLLGYEQTQKMLTDIQLQATGQTGIPVFLCVDEEGGRVCRIAGRKEFGVKKISPMGALAALQNQETIYSTGSFIGSYLKDLGFNVDFAPDADVLTLESNTAIGDRSFGKDPRLVAEDSWAFAEGLNSQGILATYKHFPGHGGTKEDTHEGYAFNDQTLEELETAELIPFADGAQKGVDLIMTAHICLPNILEENVPTSLSKEMLTGMLREKMGYRGLIITDALNMGAITKNYTSAQAAKKAFLAGADLLLMPVDFSEAYRSILEAVEKGEITQERLDESVYRIVSAKEKILRMEAGN